MPAIKAAVCHTFGAPLTVETVDLRAPQAGEVEVTLKAVAICHSDISYADGAWGGSLPAVYGHEAAGIVTAIGTGVNGLGLGDTDVVTLIRACGTCPSCAAGQPTICGTPYDGDHGPLKTADGGKLHQAMASGAFAEKVVVDQSQIAWQAAKAALGRGADAVLVTVGAAPVYDTAPRYLAYGGKVIMVGMPATGAASTYEPANFAAVGQSLIGSKMGDVVIQRDIPWMADLYAQGRLKLNELISGRWSLDQINEAIADTKSGSAKRNVIVFD